MDIDVVVVVVVVVVVNVDILSLMYVLNVCDVYQ
jgi:hypothetical protein